MLCHLQAERHGHIAVDVGRGNVQAGFVPVPGHIAIITQRLHPVNAADKAGQREGADVHVPVLRFEQRKANEEK